MKTNAKKTIKRKTILNQNLATIGVLHLLYMLFACIVFSLSFCEFVVCCFFWRVFVCLFFFSNCCFCVFCVQFRGVNLHSRRHNDGERQPKNNIHAMGIPKE